MGVGGGARPDVATRVCGAAETGVYCIKTAGMTLVIASIPNASAAASTGGFSAGLKLLFPEDAVEVRVLLKGSHEFFVGKLNLGGEGGNSIGDVILVIAVGGGDV